MRTAVTEYGGNPGRSGHAVSLRAAETVYACRTDVAELFGASPGKRRLYTERDACAQYRHFRMPASGRPCRNERPGTQSVLRPVYRLHESGVRYDVAPVNMLDDDATVEAYRRAIRPETKMLIATAASNLLGLRLRCAARRACKRTRADFRGRRRAAAETRSCRLRVTRSHILARRGTRACTARRVRALWSFPAVSFPNR